MKTTAIKTVLTGAVMLAAASLCPAQDTTTAPRITVTAGQGGYVVLPDTRPEPRPYALTGEQPTRQSSKLWQQQLGPVMQFGNTRVTLPAAR